MMVWQLLVFIILAFVPDSDTNCADYVDEVCLTCANDYFMDPTTKLCVGEYLKTISVAQGFSSS